MHIIQCIEYNALNTKLWLSMLYWFSLSLCLSLNVKMFTELNIYSKLEWRITIPVYLPNQIKKKLLQVVDIWMSWIIMNTQTLIWLPISSDSNSKTKRNWRKEKSYSLNLCSVILICTELFLNILWPHPLNSFNP